MTDVLSLDVIVLPLLVAKSLTALVRPVLPKDCEGTTNYNMSDVSAYGTDGIRPIHQFASG